MSDKSLQRVPGEEGVEWAAQLERGVRALVDPRAAFSADLEVALLGDPLAGIGLDPYLVPPENVPIGHIISAFEATMYNIREGRRDSLDREIGFLLSVVGQGVLSILREAATRHDKELTRKRRERHWFVNLLWRDHPIGVEKLHVHACEDFGHLIGAIQGVRADLVEVLRESFLNDSETPVGIREAVRLLPILDAILALDTTVLSSDSHTSLAHPPLADLEACVLSSTDVPHLDELKALVALIGDDNFFKLCCTGGSSFNLDNDIRKFLLTFSGMLPTVRRLKTMLEGDVDRYTADRMGEFLGYLDSSSNRNFS
jgi:hypothetical protein